MAEESWGLQVAPVDWGSQEREAFRRGFLDAAGLVRPDGAERRQALCISVEDAGGLGDDVPAPATSFQELGVLPRYALEGLQSCGITSPMPVQAQALPIVLSGQDVIGLAQTGSGKTLAFLLPSVVHVEAQSPLARNAATPIVLVLAPTRELAVQISDEAGKVLRYSRQSEQHRGGVWCTVVYGGGNKREQISSLRGSHIVVATPGRLIDFVASQVISLQRVTYLVLDEADRMLDMGFHGDVTTISDQVRPERQVLFFSATWSRDVQTLARGLCHEGSRPVRISVGQAGRPDGEDAEDAQAAHMARKGIEQEVVVVDFPGDWERQAAEKRRLLEEYLQDRLEESEDHKILVFVSQKTLADELSEKLWNAGFKADAMHGGKQQEQRLWVLDQFRQGKLRLLVATDVLGRGIDIPAVSHVVVYDMGGIEDYVHRIGRTARGVNAKGKALVFFEYYHKCPEIAGQLVEVLEGSEQPVPRELRRIAAEVQQGKREVFDPNAKWGGGKWNGGAEWKGGGQQWGGQEWGQRPGADTWAGKAKEKGGYAPAAPASVAAAPAPVGRKPQQERKPEPAADSWEDM